MYFAIYSEKMAKVAGVVLYKRRNGEIVACTAVGDTPNCGAKWDDIQHLWMVDEFISRESEGLTHEIFRML